MNNKQDDSTGAIADLQENLKTLIQASKNPGISSRSRKKLEEGIRKIIAELSNLLNELDPIRQPTALFDPSNPKVVGRFVSLAMVAQSRHPLASINPFTVQVSTPFIITATLNHTCL